MDYCSVKKNLVDQLICEVKIDDEEFKKKHLKGFITLIQSQNTQYNLSIN